MAEKGEAVAGEPCGSHPAALMACMFSILLFDLETFVWMDALSALGVPVSRLGGAARRAHRRGVVGAQHHARRRET